MLARAPLFASGDDDYILILFIASNEVSVAATRAAAAAAPLPLSTSARKPTACVLCCHTHCVQWRWQDTGGSLGV